MSRAFFVSDLHGSIRRYEALFARLKNDPPHILFLGGDLFPGAMRALFDLRCGEDFLKEFLWPHLDRLRESLGARYPDIFLILGNDDGRYWEPIVLDMAAAGYWHYLHNRHVLWQGYDLFGYNYVPPTPFRLKDWERYDVSRFVDPGCVAPGEGVHTVPVSDYELEWATIADDLERLTAGHNLARAIMLFHTPPYQTVLDRAALDGKFVDHAPLDVHVGSIAVKRLIESRQPWLTLHGHVHEAVSITGRWLERIGRSAALGAAHDGPELTLLDIDLENPVAAQRLLL